MRGKKAIKNTLFSLLEQGISIVCAFILPRLILTMYGSKYNGLITSITQFLTCAVLLRAGIGGATRAALYKPLAKKNQDEINSIVKATDNFMKKVGLILGISILLFATVYPLLTIKEFDWFFTFSLFIIIGASTFAESFFGITYSTVLAADQKVWVSSLIRSVSYIFNVIIASVLILNKFDIRIVKLGSAIVFCMSPIVLQFYVKKNYNLNLNVKPNSQLISQRWDAFWQQIAAFVMTNTDVMVLTIFTNMYEVSVYSIYSLVTNGLKKIILSFSDGLEAAFGNMIAKSEYKELNENVSIIEVIFYSLATAVYSCTIVLIFQFISIYTKGINDVNYIRPFFACVILCAHFFDSIRLPYQLVVQAAGHYKQTKKGAIIEPIINITVSVILSIRYGLVGVAIGTLVAVIFRTIQYSNYMSKNIVKRNKFISYYKCFVYILEGLIIIFVSKRFSIKIELSYFNWCINAIITVLVSMVVIGFGNITLFKKETKNLIIKLKNIKK